MKRLITNLRNIWYCDADASRATSTEILVQWKTQDPAKGYFPAHELLVKRDWAKKNQIQSPYEYGIRGVQYHARNLPQFL